MTPLNVLVVEDEFPTAKALSCLFTGGGYRCRIASDGIEALEKIAEEKPDLIVLDLDMPRMDGVEVCRRIREREEYRDVYVIVVTALGQDEDLARALDAGANEYLTKPFNPPVLLERVAAILRPSGSPKV
jgi:DNA-binding response OmpR family regulator